MKTRLFPSLLVASAMTVLLLTVARGQDDVSSIKFSDPSKPGTLKIVLSNGDVRIDGKDTTEVTVRSELQPEEAGQRRDGLRVLTSSSSYSLTEKNNIVTLSYGNESWPGNSGEFGIEVPTNTNIVVANSFGGEIHVTDVAGDLEIKSLNGEVRLDGVAGGVLVETMNGEINVNVRAIVEGKPLSFTSMNGEVAIHLPVDAKANVQLRTHNGAILTDFDDKQLVTKTASLKHDRRSSYGMSNRDAAEIRETVREAVRYGIDAAREAARGARDGIREAQRAAGEAAEAAEAEVDTEAIVAPIPPVPPLPPMTGGKIVTGTLNGGGPEIRVSTMNGDVTLKKAE